MSTRKDKFSLKDKRFMELALYLASARKGLTGNNPAVGCLIVKNDKIISIGQTGFNGRPHAEDNAIKNSLENLNGAKMYVTLEPCNHYGKTPPCTNTIINSATDEAMIAANADGSVDLYHDASKRLFTTTAGITVQNNAGANTGISEILKLNTAPNNTNDGGSITFQRASSDACKIISKK